MDLLVPARVPVRGARAADGTLPGGAGRASSQCFARRLAHAPGAVRGLREASEAATANDMPMISSTYYYRTLPISTKTLFDAFLGFVSDRRNAAKGL